MSYAQNNVTLIDDLPLLDEIELPKTQGLSMIPPGEVNKYQKFVRNSGYSPDAQSGMMMSDRGNTSLLQMPRKNSTGHVIGQVTDNNNEHKLHHSHHSHHHKDHYAHYNAMNQYRPYEAEMVYENYKDQKQSKKENYTNNDTNNCVDVAEHAENCVVCSKLYKNDRTIFILIIIFLAVVNLLLLKRILETERH